MPAKLSQLARSSALPATVAVVVLGAGSAFAAGSIATSSSGEPTDVVVQESDSPTGEPTVSDTPTGEPTTDESPTGEPTVGETPTEEPTEESSTDEPEPTATTSVVTCESARNHGEWVSYVARTTPRGPDFSAAVREAAQSDCGKGGDGAVEDGGSATASAADADQQDKGNGKKNGKNKGKGNGRGR